MVCATSKGSDQPAHMRSLIRAFASRFSIFLAVKLKTEHHLEFHSLKGGCTAWSESTLVKMPYCWKSLVMAHIRLLLKFILAILVKGLLVNIPDKLFSILTIGSREDV